MVPWSLVLVSCNWWVPPELVERAKDRDGDGYAAWQVLGTDCDDTDPSVHPAATEVCGDLVDNDCDNEIDEEGEGSVRWYRDADRDGHGVPGDTRMACETAVLDGWARTPDDCDDLDADSFPGAPDLDCNGVDNDCDGTPDSDNLAYDADGDGFGAHPSLGWCSDCNDGDPTVFPGAPELCDQRDNDCDDDIDEDALPTTGEIGYPSLAEAVEGSLAGSLPVTIELCPGHHELSTARVHQKADLTVRGWPDRSGPTPREVIVEEPDGNTVFLVVGGRLRLEHLVVADSLHQSAINLTNLGRLEVHDSVIADSQRGIEVRATDQGGAVVVLTDTEIRDCDAGGGEGGGLYLAGGFDLTMEGGAIRDNTAFLGGGIYVVGNRGTLHLDGAQISTNTASRGGGIAAITYGDAETHGQITLSGVTIDDNTASSEGGGVWLEQADLRGDGSSLLQSNQSKGTGGGVSLLRARLEGLDIAGNHANAGGGVYLRSSTGAPSSRLDGVTLRENTASVGCAMVVQSPADPLPVESSVVRDHSCPVAAVYVASGSLESISTEWLRNSGGHLDGTACGPCSDPSDGVGSFVFP